MNQDALRCAFALAQRAGANPDNPPHSQETFKAIAGLIWAAAGTDEEAMRSARRILDRFEQIRARRAEALHHEARSTD